MNPYSLTRLLELAEEAAHITPAPQDSLMTRLKRVLCQGDTLTPTAALERWSVHPEQHFVTRMLFSVQWRVGAPFLHDTYFCWEVWARPQQLEPAVPRHTDHASHGEMAHHVTR